MHETNLPEARLRNERARTIFQLTSYADACEKGDWLDARIDTAIQTRNPPKPDIRKMLIPLGPGGGFWRQQFSNLHILLPVVIQPVHLPRVAR
jgi:hypothetical protein